MSVPRKEGKVFPEYCRRSKKRSKSKRLLPSRLKKANSKIALEKQSGPAMNPIQTTAVRQTNERAPSLIIHAITPDNLHLPLTKIIGETVTLDITIFNNLKKETWRCRSSICLP